METPTEGEIKIDLGSGRAKLAGYVTVDKQPAVGADITADIGEQYFPLPSKYVVGCDEVRAHHILEHLTSEEAMYAMRHVWQMLKPGGIADIEVPLFPHPASVQDPTHVSFWNVEKFWYFTKGNAFGEAFAKRTPGSPLFEKVDDGFRENAQGERWAYAIRLRRPE